jgi:lipid-binding SYLF domain-containing protein
VKRTSVFIFLLSMLFSAYPALADEYSDTVDLFKKAGQSADFFKSSYAYAVFPTIGKGGLGIGGAHGDGRVYQQGKYIADTAMTQVTVGLQAGGESFSQMIFFKDKRALDEFSTGNFAFDGTASATAITSSASASAGTAGGASAGTSSGKNDASAKGSYHKGMAIFMIVKGGAMLEASVGGQKFSYKPRT